MKGHFICTGGCGGISDIPGVCETTGCIRKGEPLFECHCDDGKHEEAFNKDIPKDSDLSGKPDLPEVKSED